MLTPYPPNPLTTKKDNLTPEEAVMALKEASSLLIATITSRHIVFTSPAPSSTEAAIRRCVLRATAEVEKALAMLKA